jgi:hypothetical protein
MRNDEDAIDGLLAEYRKACPDVKPSANFMPELWRRIDARRGFWSVFQSLGRIAAAAALALCLLVAALNLAYKPSNPTLAGTYPDALAADHTAERTYYTEAIAGSAVVEEP